jgi:hypothetical protein
MSAVSAQVPLRRNADTALFGAGHAVRSLKEFLVVDHIPFSSDDDPRAVLSTVTGCPQRSLIWDAMDICEQDRESTCVGDVQRFCGIWALR